LARGKPLIVLICPNMPPAHEFWFQSS